MDDQLFDTMQNVTVLYFKYVYCKSYCTFLETLQVQCTVILLVILLIVF